MYIKRILRVLIPGSPYPCRTPRIPVSFVSRVPVSGDLGTWNLHPCSICGLTNHDHHKCSNRETSKPHIQVQCGWIDVQEWKKVTSMLKAFYKMNLL